MNFLQLCQRTAIECGVASGSAIATVLPTVVGATGSIGRIVGWVGDALTDILMDHDDWNFMRSSVLLGGGVSFQTIAGVASYSLGLASDFGGDLGGDFSGAATGLDPELLGKWDTETFRCFPTAVGFNGEQFLNEITFDEWRNGYMLGAMRSVQTRPVVIAVGPDQSLNLGPPPTDAYTITADYFVAPIEMVADTDIPQGLPTRFHMLICYRAMMKYGQYEAAQEVYARGSEENSGMYAQLMAARAPRFSFGGALA